jgi:mutator protein MutT
MLGLPADRDFNRGRFMDAAVNVVLGILSERRRASADLVNPPLTHRVTPGPATWDENGAQALLKNELAHHNPKQAVEERPWHILITRRPDDAIYGGYWEIPGGKIEPGESPQAALVREFQEELGLGIVPGVALDEVAHVYPHAKVRLRPFFCKREPADDQTNSPRNLAVAEHRWVLPNQLGGYRFPEANASIISQVLDFLQKNTLETGR